MLDPAPRRGPLTRSERWIAGVILLGVAGLFTAEVVVNYQPGKLALLLVALCWVPLLAWHEAGHALAAALLGWHVGLVVIGMGRPLGRFRVGRTVVEVRLYPLEGFVQPVPTGLRAVRLKSAIIYFAGPGAELLLLGAVALAVGPGTMLTRSDAWGVLAAQSLAIAVVVSVFINLVPHAAPSQNGPVSNDGLGIIRSFLLPESHFADLVGMTYDEPSGEWKPYDPADWWKR